VKVLKVESLPLELVDPPVNPLRKSINPEYIRELGESIRENGLYEPIQVRPVDARYEVVFGHCRYLAHRMIGLDKIRAIVKAMSDEEVVVARAVENLQRENLTPMETAGVFRVLQESMNLSPMKIAQRTGKALSTVQKYLKLLDLEPDFQKAVNAGRLSMSAALELNRIDDEKMRAFYFTAAIDNGVTEEVARAWVSDYEKTKAAKYYDEVGGVPGTGLGIVSAPVYHTCAGCKGPVEVGKVRMVGLCPDCVRDLERG